MRVLIDRIMNLSRLGIAMFLGALAILGLTAFVLVARFVNTAPVQCASCHPEMTALWKSSRVHPAGQVSCYRCHADHATLPQGFNLPGYVRDLLIPERYMASKERLIGRCLECHAEIPRNVAERGKFIKVNHKVHLERPLIRDGKEIRLDCVECHASIAHDLTDRPTNRPKMQGCFAGGCHVKDRKADSCTRCHYQNLLEKVLSETVKADASAGEAVKEPGKTEAKVEAATHGKAGK